MSMLISLVVLGPRSMTAALGRYRRCQALDCESRARRRFGPARPSGAGFLGSSTDDGVVSGADCRETPQSRCAIAVQQRHAGSAACPPKRQVMPTQTPRGAPATRNCSLRHEAPLASKVRPGAVKTFRPSAPKFEL